MAHGTWLRGDPLQDHLCPLVNLLRLKRLMYLDLQHEMSGRIFKMRIPVYKVCVVNKICFMFRSVYTMII
jgi:hypothetical protein